MSSKYKKFFQLQPGTSIPGYLFTDDRVLQTSQKQTDESLVRFRVVQVDVLVVSCLDCLNLLYSGELGCILKVGERW